MVHRRLGRLRIGFSASEIAFPGGVMRPGCSDLGQETAARGVGLRQGVIQRIIQREQAS